jgi:2,3-dihydroxybenzoate decarboxylase/5-carboxyvanillate decarboxylase
MAGKIRTIATEEAWSIPEVAAALREVGHGPTSSLDKLLVAGIYDAKADKSGYGTMNFLDGLLDVEGSAGRPRRS